MPLFDSQEARKRSADKENFQLTGYGIFTVPPGDEWDEWNYVRLVAAGMTFAQQQEVTTSALIEISPGDSVDALLSDDRLGRSFRSTSERHSFGSAIKEDVWSRNSRCSFLNTFCDRFAQEKPDDALRQAFFRHTEIWRLATPFVELHHFLAFSALELIARDRSVYSSNRNAAVPIADVLNQHGFKTTQRDIEKWCHARNAAFHSGKLVSQDPATGEWIKLTDQLFPITMVVCDLLLKLLPFDDGLTNWNRWRDRMN